jgi:uncharacterized protein
MQGLTKAQEEIRALEGLRKQRLNKYQEALKKQAEIKTATNLSVQQLDEERKKLKGDDKTFRSTGEKSDIRQIDEKIVADYEGLRQQRPQGLTVQRRASVSRSSNSSSPPSPEQKIKDEEEMTAKSCLARLLDKPGVVSVVATKFKEIRTRYLQAIEACRPTTIDVSNALGLEAAKKRRAARREQAQKKDKMGRIQRAWDNYEEKAQDRPPTMDVEEMLDEERVANVEAEVNNAWISYAKQVAVEAAEEEDDDDLAYWIAEAKRLRAEAEARRLARLRALEERVQSEEDDYWIEEALKLRAKHKGDKGKVPITATDNDDDANNNDDEDMALALKLRSTQRRKVYSDETDGALDGKQAKKKGSASEDSDSDDDGGATFPKKKGKKKTFDRDDDDDDSDGIASKVRKKGQVATGDDDDEDVALALKLRSKQRKVYNDDDDGDDALDGKQFKKGRIYGSDSDSDKDDKGGATFQKTQRRKKTFVADDDSDRLASKVLKKGRVTNDKDDDEDDVAQATKLRSQQRKAYGDKDDGALEGKRLKKGRVGGGSDSDSDNDDTRGAAIQKQQQKKKTFAGDDADSEGLTSKAFKKSRAHAEHSDSDSDDEPAKGVLVKHQSIRKKDYETLPSKASKKGQAYTAAPNQGDVMAAAKMLERKKYGTTDPDIMAEKKFKKGRKYNSDSESDADDEGGASFQKERRRKNYGTGDQDGTLAAKQKKKGSYCDADSDEADKTVHTSQQRKNYGPSDCGALSAKMSKKWQKLNADSESEDDDAGGASHPKKKSYGQCDDGGLSTKLKKKATNFDDDGDDSDSSGSDDVADAAAGSVGKTKKGSVGGVQAVEDRKSDNTPVRRKNYGRAHSNEPLPAKQMQKSTAYLSENSEEPLEKPLVRRRKKRFENDENDDNNGLGLKQGRKTTGSPDSDSSVSHDDDDDDEIEQKTTRLKQKVFEKDSDSDVFQSKKATKKGNTADDDSNSGADDEPTSSKGTISMQRRKQYSKDELEEGLGSKKKKKGAFVPINDSDDDVPPVTSTKQASSRNLSSVKKNSHRVNSGESQRSIGVGDAAASSLAASQRSLNASLANKSDDNVLASSDEECDTKKQPRKSFSIKKAVQLKEDDKVMADEPKNPDGSPWKNPLKSWTNPPKTDIVLKGARFVLKVPPKTDCWRKTMRNGRTVDKAPFHWQKITGDFRLQVKIFGTLTSVGQKAGLMIRLDEENWIFSGMECFDQRMYHTTLMTVDHTDRSRCPLPQNAEKAGVWFSLRRLSGSYECHYSYDGIKWVLTRLGTFTERPVLYVGIAAANPSSQSSSSVEDMRVSFDYYTCQTGGYLM